MTKKRIIILVLIIVAVLILGLVALYAIRNINEKAPVVVDQTQKSDTTEQEIDQTPKTVLTGTLNGVDALHWGKGSIEVIVESDGPVLSFGDDFEVAQGPDLHVYLSPNAAGEELGEFATLGPLHTDKGAQEYILPSNYEDYKTVVIWCRAFGVTFATAELT
jgi:hypothetical protein